MRPYEPSGLFVLRHFTETTSTKIARTLRRCDALLRTQRQSTVSVYPTRSGEGYAQKETRNGARNLPESRRRSSPPFARYGDAWNTYPRQLAQRMQRRTGSFTSRREEVEKQNSRPRTKEGLLERGLYTRSMQKNDSSRETEVATVQSNHEKRGKERSKA